MNAQTHMPLAELATSAPRRYFGQAVLFILAAILLKIALGSDPLDAFWRMVLGGIGLLTLYVLFKFNRATKRKLFLTETALLDDQGNVLAQMRDVVQVNRGSFAVKPSNGFTLVMQTSAPIAWQPGLWWRFGRRLAVGGVTPAPQTRIMAEQIEHMVLKSQ